MKKGVLTFWISPQEEGALIDFIDALGPVAAYESKWKETRGAVVPHELKKYIHDSNPGQLILAPTDGHLAIEEHVFGTKTRYNLTAEKSTIVVYRRGKLFGGQLGQSNLAFYYDVETRPAGIDEQFEAWAKDIFKWVKKYTPHRDSSGNYRVSIEAKKGAESGAWVLI